MKYFVPLCLLWFYYYHLLFFDLTSNNVLGLPFILGSLALFSIWMRVTTKDMQSCWIIPQYAKIWRLSQRWHRSHIKHVIQFIPVILHAATVECKHIGFRISWIFIDLHICFSQIVVESTPKSLKLITRNLASPRSALFWWG